MHKSLTIHPRYEGMRSFLETLPQRFEHEGTEIYHKRNVVRLFRPGTGTWVVKRYKRPHLLQRIVYTFWRSSKAARAFAYAARLRALGIDTPHEIACLEVRRGGLLRDAYFVSEHCPYDSVKNLADTTERLPADFAEVLARFLAEMHEKGFLHGDLNLSNVLYHRTGTQGIRFAVIDTNRSRFCPQPTRRACLDNLKRLTHHRALLEQVVSAYARCREWPEAECVQAVVEAVERFERRKALKKKWLHRH